MAKYRTLKVRLSGNINFPRVFITRETVKREYGVTGASLARIQKLFDSNNGRIYVDIENSNIELTSIKDV